MKLAKGGIILLLCLINFLNYVDRGIIPGAPEVFEDFIRNTLGVAVSRQALFFGILASSFIASYAIFSILFGYLSTYYPPFNIIICGMSIWCIATTCCGLAQYIESYYLLLLGRVLTGVGEASFQCTAAPLIDDYAPPTQRSIWMGIFLSSISVGTAVGYMYGALFAHSSWGWSGAFIFETLAMLIIVLMSAYIVPDRYNKAPIQRGTDEEEIKHELLNKKTLSQLSNDNLSCFNEVLDTFSNKIFVLVALGHSAYTFSLAALSVFSPILLLDLGMFESESEASFTFGLMGAAIGTLGTILGGIILDRVSSRYGDSSYHRAVLSLQQIFWMMIVGFLLSLVAYLSIPSKYSYLIVTSIALLFLFGVAPAETTVVMELFPKSRRSFAIASNTLLIHILGDVPSPIILGLLKDSWAPRCGTIEVDGRPILNPDCVKDREGLMNVLLFPLLWFCWTIILWGLAYLILKNEKKLS